MNVRFWIFKRDQKIIRKLKQGFAPKEISKNMGLSVSVIYHAIRREKRFEIESAKKC